MTGKFKAFISYSHGDTRWAEWLQRSLEGYKMPRSHIYPKNDKGEKGETKLGKIFRDRDELKSGSSLGVALRIALQASENLIVICSPRSARSEHVNQEIIEFKRLGRENALHALIVEGEPYGSRFQGKEDLECLPRALQFDLDEQGNLTDRPAPELLAPDARSDKDGKKRALIKLISGLLDIDFDILWQRERRRQRTRIAATSISVFAGVALLVAGIYIFKTSVVDPPAVRATITSARTNLALLCREKETLGRKEVGLRIAKELGDAKMVEAFSKIIEAHKANIAKMEGSYVDNIKKLTGFGSITVLRIINETEQLEKFWQLTGDDYKDFIDTGHLPTLEAILQKCPS